MKDPVLTRSAASRRALTITLLVAAGGRPASQALAQTPASTGSTPPAVRVGGTGSALGTMRLVADTVTRRDPAFRLAVVPNLGSGGGLRALHAGAIDVALISRALKPDEVAAGLRAFEYGRSPFVLVTSRRSGGGLTRAEVAALLADANARWPDGSPVRLVLRPPSDGDTGLLAAMSPQIADALKSAQARPGMVVAMNDQDAANEAERLPGSLGASTLALLLSEGRRLQALAIDGVTPSVQTLADGRYPYFKPLLAVWRGEPSPGAQKLLAALRSPAGRALLEANGHVVPR